MCNSETCARNRGRCGDGVRAVNDTVMGIDGLTRLFGANGDVLIYRENCDDGNLFDGDGCSSDCKVEYLWKCNYMRIAADICLKVWAP